MVDHQDLDRSLAGFEQAHLVVKSSENRWAVYFRLRFAALAWPCREK
jgi:hypothetical protein